MVYSYWNILKHLQSSTIKTFKDRWDKFWANQDVLYNNYKSDLHGIGYRSVIM